ncbi:hypothetical protein BpHYR1_049588 [Brachionus plicatilis]|uniref:Uncharacterized protein n=1 Tax=Brachionus plicatilis TaxID=10195 RepID=A0A3M7RZJ2_BRAPC|nr:hypothetical protein BpHYR1_049588 [Brachionus plicatilis]
MNYFFNFCILLYGGNFELPTCESKVINHIRLCSKNIVAYWPFMQAIPKTPKIIYIYKIIENYLNHLNVTIYSAKTFFILAGFNNVAGLKGKNSKLFRPIFKF